MNLREIIDKAFLEQAGKVELDIASILAAISRFDVDSGVDRLLMINNYGHLIGLPSRPGTTSTATTGVPTNGVVGFAPGALFLNYKGTAGSVLYVNQGTNTSATWLNIA